MKIIKPNYVVGFLKVFAWVFCFAALFSGVIPYFRGDVIHWPILFQMATIGGVFMGLGVCVMFTPRAISWDSDKIILRVNFPKSGEYRWDQLEAYSTWSGRYATFLLKFEGMQSYQIVAVCFPPEEWKEFQATLRTCFPEKKTWMWLGPFPIRFGKK